LIKRSKLLKHDQVLFATYIYHHEALIVKGTLENHNIPYLITNYHRPFNVSSR